MHALSLILLAVSVSADLNITLDASDVAGYWWWTWSDSSKSAPSGTNLGVAFNGYADPSKALRESSGVKSKLPGIKFISLGGGDSDGRFTKSIVQSITSSINSGAFNGYAGIAYDIEEGDSNLGQVFADSFRAAKAKGFKVMVTISNSAPYGVSDGASLMRGFFPNSDIDYLSPQLYETGNESSNSYVTGKGVQWTEYASAKAAVIPSIVKASYYSDAKSYFKSKGVTTFGYVQWQQGSGGGGCSCSWCGHCAGDACSTYNDCDGSMTCVNGKCA